MIDNSSVPSVEVEIKARLDQLEDDLSRAQERINQFERSVGGPDGIKIPMGVDSAKITAELKKVTDALATNPLSSVLEKDFSRVQASAEAAMRNVIDTLKPQVGTIRSIFRELGGLFSDAFSFRRAPALSREQASYLADLRTITQTGQSAAISVQGLGAAAQQADSNVSALTGRLGLAAAAAAAFGVALSLVNNALAEVDKLGRQSENTRLSPNVLLALRVQAADARVSLTELDAALSKFTEVSKQSEDAAEKFYKALKNIDPTLVSAFKSASTQQQRLDIIADAYRRADTEVKRYQLTQEAFGSDSDRLGKILERGAAGLAEYRDKAEEFGLTLGSGVVTRAQEAAAQIELLSTVIKTRLAVEIADQLDKLPNWQHMLSTGITSTISSLKDQVSGLADALRDLRYAWDLLKKGASVVMDDVPQALDYWRQALSINESDAERLLREFKTRGRQMGEAYFDSFYDAVTNQIKPEALAGPIQSVPLPRPRLGPPAFQERPDLSTSKAENEYTRLAKSIERTTAALEGEAAAVGQSVGEHKRMTTEARLWEAAAQSGKKPTAELSAEIARIAKRAGDATQKLAELKLASDVFFERSTALLSSSDQQIAGRLRAVYGDRGWQTQMNSAIANQMRFNDALRQTGSILENNLATGITDVLTETKTLKAGFADTAKAIIRALEEMIVKMVILRPLMQGLNSFISPSNPTPSGFAQAPAPWGGTMLTAVGHSGGMIGSLSEARYIHPAYFENATRFAAGLGARAPGINEVPVLAHRGEMIGWPSQMRQAFGGSTVNINVENHGADVEVADKKQNAAGGVDLRLVVRGIMQDDLAKGRHDSSMSRYGARVPPRLV